MAVNTAPLSQSLAQTQTRARDITEVIFGFGIMMVVVWLPTREQLIVGPIALLSMLALVLVRRPGLNQLGLGWRSLIPSFWILPAALALTAGSILLAKKAGTYHPLYSPDFSHVAGYVLWTMYQQFLLQDYFLPRLLRLIPSTRSAISIAAVLFSIVHLPNLPLVAATVVWGAVSCALFLRYRNLYVLGIVQGLLGLTFAVCIPDALHHHMRVGLGFIRYVAK
ncbi:MAG TPA: CPBP family intramembrane glutamic endopeptidase [Candidatus Sulfotelmatobacter sp.]|nr:CPBP family intramembrane glutamic endopeptidase [Candidatus Sulfotelmatobacter sp.]